MIRNPISKKKEIVIGLISIALLVIVYEGLAYRQYSINPNSTAIPGFVEMGRSIIEACQPDRRGDIPFVEDLKATFSRYFLGMGIAIFISIIAGILMGCFESTAAFLNPSLSFSAKIPPTAMLAVFLVLVGSDMSMYIAMIVFGVCPTLIRSIHQSVKYDVHEEQISKAYTLGASHVEVIWNVVSKQVFPRLLESIRSQIGPAMVYLIAAELLMASVGFGYTLRIETRIQNFGIVYDYLIVLAVAGFLMDSMMTQIRKYTCPWFDREK